MVRGPLHNMRRQARHILYIQAVAITIATMLALFVSTQVAYSLAIGGAICALGSVLLATLCFRTSGASAAGKILVHFYSGEIVKILFTVISFFLVIKYSHVVLPPLVIGYMIAQVSIIFTQWKARPTTVMEQSI